MRWVCVVVRSCRGVDGVVEGTTSSLALLGHWWLLPEGPSGAVVDGEDWCFVW